MKLVVRYRLLKPDTTNRPRKGAAQLKLEIGGAAAPALAG